jgi:hypothetical protein
MKYNIMKIYIDNSIVLIIKEWMLIVIEQTYYQES